MNRTESRRSTRLEPDQPVRLREVDPGGPPGPFTIAFRGLSRVTPEGMRRRVRRTLTAPPPTTLVPATTMDAEFQGPTQRVPWLMNAVITVGRNSRFHTEGLTDAHLEEIGGVEYRALRVLGYLVAAVRHRHVLFSSVLTVFPVLLFNAIYSFLDYCILYVNSV